MWQVHSRQCTSRENTRYTKRIKLPGKGSKALRRLLLVHRIHGFGIPLQDNNCVQRPEHQIILRQHLFHHNSCYQYNDNLNTVHTLRAIGPLIDMN